MKRYEGLLFLPVFAGCFLTAQAFLGRRPSPSPSTTARVFPRKTTTALEAGCVASQSLVQYDAVDTDPGLLSDALLELGATSVTVEDAKFGTENETPIFRHHSHSPTWRGGKGGGEDPALGRMDARGVVVDEESEELAQQQKKKKVQQTNSGDDMEEGWQPSEFWERSVVTASFPSSWDLAEVSKMLQLTLGLEEEPGFVVAEDGFGDEDTDWTKKVQEAWDPILVGNLLIAFPWHDAAARAAFGPYEHSVVLEGGVAFGTGEHPTTRLCVEWLQATLGGDGDGTGTGKGDGERGGGGGGGGGGGSGAQRVLDYGSGSGILGLSAARLGAEEVVGVEVDRDAIAAAHRNADLNGIGSPEDRSLFHCHLPPEAIEASLEAGGAPHVTRNALAAAAEPDCTPLPVGTAPFDVAVANILAGPLTQLAPTIAALVVEGRGRLALSGVLEGQEDRVLDAYRPFFPDVAVARQREEWLLITGTRGSGGVGVGGGSGGGGSSM